MRREKSSIGHTIEIRNADIQGNNASLEEFVLEKNIFTSVFEKDIRRVFIYKKTERLAKAIHLILPAFAESASLRNRIDAIAVGLVDAAMMPLSTARTLLSRELLALSSLLSIARTSGFLSSMNADIISREAHLLLQEVAAYEDPRVLLDESTSLSSIAKQTLPKERSRVQKSIVPKGHSKSIKDVSDRSESILSVIKNKGKASIKDISTLIRGVSEKTIQRELFALVASGKVKKQGERRWSVYSLS